MLKRKIFGLDISDHSIEALILAKPLFGRTKAIAYARTILKGEIVKNGIIRKPEKLAEDIIKLLESAQPQPIKTPYCILSLPESQVFTTIFKLPAGLKRKEIKNTIPYKAEEVIPFKSSEVYFDFRTVMVEGSTQEVFYVAVPIKVVESYAQVLEKIGLKPVAFDLESVSLARAVVDGSRKPDKAKLLMDIGARTTNLNIFDKKGIRQSLTIKIAGDRFTKAIMSKLNISSKQADELKMKIGFDPKKENGKVLLVLQNEFKRIIAETKKLVDYYQGQNQRQIGEIILAGGSSLLPKIDQYLADNLEIESRIGDPLIKINDPKELIKLKNKAILFANVIGLALRGISRNPAGGDINLLPILARRIKLVPEKTEKKAWLLLYIRLAVLILLLIGFGGLIFYRLKGQDIYHKFVPKTNYEMNINPNIDINALYQLRENLLVPSTTPILEETAEPEVKVKIKPISGGYLNVREGPGTNYGIIDRISSGTEYVFIEEEGNWYKIQLAEEKEGWITSSFAEKIEESKAPESAANPNVLGESTGPEVKVRIKDTSLGYLNVRQGPGINFEKIGEVLPGKEYIILEEKDSWYKIEIAANTTGWVYSLYVDKLE